MILTRLFKSPWRKDDTAALRPAAAPISQESLAEQLRNPDPTVRRMACGQITDLCLLQTTAETDSDASVRACAADKLSNMLAGTTSDCPDLIARLSYCEEHISGTNQANLAAHLLLQGKAPELRQLILPKVTDQAILAECALHDSIAALRLAAVEKLADKESLEKVARLIGKKDKGVYRIARQKLKTIAELEQAPLRLHEEADALCTRMEKLSRRSLWNQDKALADLYVQQWAALKGTLNPELITRFTTANELFQQGYAAHQAAYQARLEAEAVRAHLQSARDELLTELAALNTSFTTTNLALDPKELASKIADINNRWLALDQEANAPLQTQERYATAIQTLQEQVELLKEIQESRKHLTQQLDAAREWLAHTAPLDSRNVREWKEAGNALTHKCHDESLNKDYRGILEQLQQRLERQQEQARQRMQNMAERTEALEQELETGILRQASALYQSLTADLSLVKLSGIGHKHYGVIEQRLHKLTPRLRELQSWRKWGTNQHRLDMCETLERLATEDVAPAALAEQVQSLQQEWKQLDRDGNRVNDALWKRFHKAADKVYERCKPYLEEQERLREVNRQSRESLCQQIEAFLEQVNWTQLDWKKAVRAVREVRTTWDSLGPIDARHHKTINQRYRTAMRRLNRPLAQERARNRIMRQGLITQAQALVNNPDIAQSIQEVRHIQEQWHITVASSRGQEDNLWQAFRSACDQVFERRREAMQVQQEALDAQLESLGAICESLENLAKAPGSQNLSEQFETLKANWEVGLELGLPRTEETRLQRRWQQGVAAMRRRVRLLEDAAKRAQMERLRAQAGLCAELESLVNKGPVTPDQENFVAEWQGRWTALPKNKDPVWHTALERRFNTALTAASDRNKHKQFQAMRESNTKERSLLCLQMEILAGVQSPPEALQERLAFQVSRLAGRLSQGVADPLDEFPHLERLWYASGPAYEEQMAFLEQRFDRARRVLSSRSSKDQETKST